MSIPDTPAGVTRLVLTYLGGNPNAPSPQDLADVEAVLAEIRPYIRTICLVAAARCVDSLGPGHLSVT